MKITYFTIKIKPKVDLNNVIHVKVQSLVNTIDLK